MLRKTAPRERCNGWYITSTSRDVFRISEDRLSLCPVRTSTFQQKSSNSIQSKYVWQSSETFGAGTALWVTFKKKCSGPRGPQKSYRKSGKGLMNTGYWKSRRPKKGPRNCQEMHATYATQHFREFSVDCQRIANKTKNQKFDRFWLDIAGHH